MSAVERIYCVACTEGSRQLILRLVRPMHRSAVVTFALVAFASASGIAATLEPFMFDAKFEPSFLRSSHLTLRSSGDSAKLVINISGKSASIPVDSAVAAEFLRDVTSAPVTKKEQELAYPRLFFGSSPLIGYHWGRHTLVFRDANSPLSFRRTKRT